MDAIAYFGNLLGEYSYWFLFVGMIIGGEVVLLPAIYLSFEGTLNPYVVFGVAALSTMVSDVAWYLAARIIPEGKIRNIGKVQKHQKMFHFIMEKVRKSHGWVLVISKFLYGTRILVQVASGLARIPFISYLLLNTVAICIYQLFLFGVGAVARKSVEQFSGSIWSFEIAFVGFAVVAVSFVLCIRYLALRK